MESLSFISCSLARFRPSLFLSFSLSLSSAKPLRCVFRVWVFELFVVVVVVVIF